MSIEMGELQRVAVQVVVDDDFVVGEQALDEMRADEPGPSGDQHALIGDSHAGDLSLVYWCFSLMGSSGSAAAGAGSAGSRRNGNSLSLGTPLSARAARCGPGDSSVATIIRS